MICHPRTSCTKKTSCPETRLHLQGARKNDSAFVKCLVLHKYKPEEAIKLHCDWVRCVSVCFHYEKLMISIKRKCSFDVHWRFMCFESFDAFSWEYTNIAVRYQEFRTVNGITHQGIHSLGSLSWSPKWAAPVSDSKREVDALHTSS